MSRSNTGTGTVWEQESQPSRQPSQDTLSRTDEEEEESKSSFLLSLPFHHQVNKGKLVTLGKWVWFWKKGSGFGKGACLSEHDAVALVNIHTLSFR